MLADWIRSTPSSLSSTEEESQAHDRMSVVFGLREVLARAFRIIR
jgi:hypothetical protein